MYHEIAISFPGCSGATLCEGVTSALEIIHYHNSLSCFQPSGKSARTHNLHSNEIQSALPIIIKVELALEVKESLFKRS